MDATPSISILLRIRYLIIKYLQIIQLYEAKIGVNEVADIRSFSVLPTNNIELDILNRGTIFQIEMLIKEVNENVWAKLTIDVILD